MMSAQNLGEIASAATASGVIVAAGALVVNVFQLMEQARFNKLTHKLHAFATLHENYMRLSIRRNEAVRSGDRSKVEDVYREYFSGLFDHWDFYRNGIHEENDFVDWLYSVFDVMRGWYDLGYARSDYIWPTLGRHVVRSNVRLSFVLESIAVLARAFDDDQIAPEKEAEIRGRLRVYLRDAAKNEEVTLLVAMQAMRSAA